MAQRVVIDTNILVPLIDRQDKFAQSAAALSAVITAQQIEEVYFDFVIVEAIGVICRRAEEQRRTTVVPTLLADLSRRVTVDDIT